MQVNFFSFKLFCCFETYRLFINIQEFEKCRLRLYDLQTFAQELID